MQLIAKVRLSRGEDEHETGDLFEVEDAAEDAEFDEVAHLISNSFAREATEAEITEAAAWEAVARAQVARGIVFPRLGL